MKRFSIRFVLALCALLLLSCNVLVALPFGRAPAKVWILTYHSVSADPDKWGRYVISPDEFEADLRFLRDNGYQTILTGDLAVYVTEGRPLPERPVMLTLDDGYLDSFTTVLPLLEAYRMRAVVSLVGEHIDAARPGNPGRGMLTWPEARALADSGWVELANHTHGLHHNTAQRNGCARNEGESARTYRALLTEDIGRAQESIYAQTGVCPSAFVYPYGAVSRASTGALRALGFAVTLTTRTGPSVLTGDPNCLYGLRRNNRPHGVGAWEIINS